MTSRNEWPYVRAPDKSIFIFSAISDERQLLFWLETQVHSQATESKDLHSILGFNHDNEWYTGS